MLDTKNYPDSWTEDDISMHLDMLDKFDQLVARDGEKINQSWLSKKARLNSGTGNLVFNGKYITSPSKHLKAMLDTLEYALSDHVFETEFIENAVAKLAFMACDHARRAKRFSTFIGEVGVGKTRSIKEYCKQTSNTYLIECNPNMRPGALLDEIIKVLELHIKPNMGVNAKFNLLVDELVDTDTLLIFDEADIVTEKALFHIRRLLDKSRIGVVLAGTERLNFILNDKNTFSEFAQVKSRTVFSPESIKGISIKDTREITNNYLAVDGVSDEIISTIHELSRGNTRNLAEKLLPTIRDFLLAKGHELTPNNIKQLAKQAVSL